MTSVFSWQNSISLCPASFCTPQPNLPVTPGIPRFPTFAFQFPIIKRTSFIGCYFQNVLQVFIELFKFNFSVLLVEAQTWITAILNGLPWKPTEIIVIFEIASKYCISDSFADYDGYSISSKGFLLTVVDIMILCVKFTHSSLFQFADS